MWVDTCKGIGERMISQFVITLLLNHEWTVRVLKIICWAINITLSQIKRKVAQREFETKTALEDVALKELEIETQKGLLEQELARGEGGEGKYGILQRKLIYCFGN